MPPGAGSWQGEGVPTDGDAGVRVRAALDALGAGRPVVVWGGDAGGGDVVVAAEHAGADAITAMALHARGLIRLALTPERCDALQLPLLPVTDGARALGYTVSIEARRGITTGISAADRARTIAVAIDADAARQDIVCPGHMFPVRTVLGGTRERRGRAEAAVDLARAAALLPAAVICHILDDTGRDASHAELCRFAGRHDMPMVSVADVCLGVAVPGAHVTLCSETTFATAHGPFRAVVFRHPAAGAGHVALVRGDVEGGDDVFVRLHGECVLGDVFHSAGCASPGRLEHGLAQVAAAGRGVLLYLARDGRGIETLGDAPEAEPGAVALGPAELEAAALIVRRLGVTGVRLVTDDPEQVAGLTARGVRVVDRLDPAPALESASAA